MAHTIKCALPACHCMLENDPGTPAYCSSACEAGTAQHDGCPCGHEECGKLRELGSGPTPSNPL